MLTIDRWVRPLAIVTASLLVTSVATIGQVQHEIDKRAARASTLTLGGDTALSTDGAATQTTGVGADPLASTGSTAPGTATVATKGVNTTSPTFVPGSAIPNFGLRTQGVTAKEVKIGLSYNVAACGDAGTLNAAFGSAVTGDPKNAIDAFTKEINRTGGIGGRTLKVAVVDDGGGDCPEKSVAAAVKMADEERCSSPSLDCTSSPTT